MTRFVNRTVFVVLAVTLFAIGEIAPITAEASERQSIICTGLTQTIGLAMDSRGNLYTANRETGRVFCLPPDSNPILYAQVTGTPLSIAVDKLRNVYVGTEEGNIFLIELDGTVCNIYQCHARPVGLDIDRDGDLVIATASGDIFRVARTAFTLNQ